MNSTETATGAESPDEALTTEQVEELCGVSKRTLLKWRRTGVLPAECLPRNIPRTRRLRWPAAAIRRFAAGATEGVDHA
jgi:predicted DNA-binding transcriptional regulator AlpA